MNSGKTSVWTCVYSFLAICSAHAAEAVRIDRIEASVNASAVLTSDIDKFRRTEKLRAQLDPLYAGTVIASHGASAKNSEVVDFLAEERLITQQFPVADSEVEQEINTIQSNNKIDRDALKEALRQQGFSFEDYFELIRSSTSKRNLIDRDIRTKVTVSDADIKNYYYNKLSKSDAGQRSYKLRLITVFPSNYKVPTAAKETAQSALKAIQEGESFEAVAKRVSEDPNASSGGDLGTITEDQVSNAIRTELKKLKIGEVSGVFGSNQAGWMVLKLEDVKSDESARLEKMKEEIRTNLLAGEYQHQIALWLERQKLRASLRRAGEPSIAGIPQQSQ